MPRHVGEALVHHRGHVTLVQRETERLEARGRGRGHGGAIGP